MTIFAVVVGFIVVCWGLLAVGGAFSGSRSGRGSRRHHHDGGWAGDSGSYDDGDRHGGGWFGGGDSGGGGWFGGGDSGGGDSGGGGDGGGGGGGD